MAQQVLSKMEMRGTHTGKRDYKLIYKGLWRYLSHHKLALFLALILNVIAGVLGITGTSLAGSAVGSIAGEGEHSVYHYLILMVLCYISSAVISYLLSYMMHRLSHGIASRMRSDVYSNLVRLPVGFFDQKQAGEIVSTISYDINTLGESLAGDFVQIISGIVTIVYSFVLMLTVSPRLILVFLLTIPLSVIFTTVISKIVRPLFRRRSATLGEMNGYIEEMIAGHKTIRAYGAEQAIIDGFDEKNNNATDAYTKAEANGTMAGPAVGFINNLSLALVNIYGAILFMSGSGLTIDGLSKFILLSRKFSGPINQIANIYSDIQSALAAAERVFHLTDAAPEPLDPDDARELVSPQGEVRFNDVSFAYTEGTPVLTNLSLSAPHGTVTAIVGPTGAGKTTIINLLMRFYDVNSGFITIDGDNIYSFTRSSLRSTYTMVLQETWLFKGTIFENVAYGKEGVTLDDVIKVCKAARIHNYVMSLPDGYDTVISEHGMNISKGQKQLLTIARAMLIDSSILILDEATSNVDSKTEKDISDAMVSLMKDKTCFVIAHRLSTIRNADNILVVRDGNVVEQGTHDTLLLKGGAYAELYRSQFEFD